MQRPRGGRNRKKASVNERKRKWGGSIHNEVREAFRD